MLKPQERIINLRTVLFLTFILIIISGLLFKYLEWTVLRQTLKTYNASWAREFNDASAISKKGDDMLEVASELLIAIEAEKVDIENITRLHNKFDNLMNTAIYDGKLYIETLEKNQKDWIKISNLSNFLIGSNRNFVKDLVGTQNNYSILEIKSSNRSLISLYTFKAYFRALYDNRLISYYSEIMLPNPETNAQKYFYIIAPLEKYTKKDFEFEKQGDIRRIYPNSFDGINKLTNYSASYYLVMKDYIAGDMDSYSYKLSKLDQDAIELNYDSSILATEGKNIRTDISKEIIKEVLRNVELIKDFKQSKNAKGIFGDISHWQEDMVLCNLYSFKMSFVQSLTGELPRVRNIQDLITELSKTKPSNQYIDSKFDDDVITLSNNKSSLIFTCKDRINQTNYRFVIYK